MATQHPPTAPHLLPNWTGLKQCTQSGLIPSALISLMTSHSTSSLFSEDTKHYSWNSFFLEILFFTQSQATPCCWLHDNFIYHFEANLYNFTFPLLCILYLSPSTLYCFTYCTFCLCWSATPYHNRDSLRFASSGNYFLTNGWTVSCLNFKQSWTWMLLHFAHEDNDCWTVVII